MQDVEDEQTTQTIQQRFNDGAGNITSIKEIVNFQMYRKLQK